MNRKLTTADCLTVSYRSPEVIVTEINNEGVLCVSSPSNEGWGEETPDW